MANLYYWMVCKQCESSSSTHSDSSKPESESKQPEPTCCKMRQFPKPENFASKYSQDVFPVLVVSNCEEEHSEPILFPAKFDNAYTNHRNIITYTIYSDGENAREYNGVKYGLKVTCHAFEFENKQQLTCELLPANSKGCMGKNVYNFSDCPASTYPVPAEEDFMFRCPKKWPLVSIFAKCTCDKSSSSSKDKSESEEKTCCKIKNLPEANSSKWDEINNSYWDDDDGCLLEIEVTPKYKTSDDEVEPCPGAETETLTWHPFRPEKVDKGWTDFTLEIPPTSENAQEYNGKKYGVRISGETSRTERKQTLKIELLPEDAESGCGGSKEYVFNYCPEPLDGDLSVISSDFPCPKDWPWKHEIDLVCDCPPPPPPCGCETITINTKWGNATYVRRAAKDKMCPNCYDTTGDDWNGSFTIGGNPESNLWSNGGVQDSDPEINGKQVCIRFEIECGEGEGSEAIGDWSFEVTGVYYLENGELHEIPCEKALPISMVDCFGEVHGASCWEEKQSSSSIPPHSDSTSPVHSDSTSPTPNCVSRSSLPPSITIEFTGFYCGNNPISGQITLQRDDTILDALYNGRDVSVSGFTFDYVEIRENVPGNVRLSMEDGRGHGLIINNGGEEVFEICEPFDTMCVNPVLYSASNMVFDLGEFDVQGICDKDKSDSGGSGDKSDSAGGSGEPKGCIAMPIPESGQQADYPQQKSFTFKFADGSSVSYNLKLGYLGWGGGTVQYYSYEETFCGQNARVEVQATRSQNGINIGGQILTPNNSLGFSAFATADMSSCEEETDDEHTIVVNPALISSTLTSTSNNPCHESDSSEVKITLPERIEVPYGQSANIQYSVE